MLVGPLRCQGPRLWQVGAVALIDHGTKADQMAVKLRLMRMGKTKQPTYRVVAADSRSPRDGRFIEIVGSYAPRQAQDKVVLKADRVQRWLKEGAQPTDRVRRILAAEGLMEAQVFRKPSVAAPAGKGTAAGPVDAGPVDAGPVDGGPVDGGPVDGDDPAPAEAYGTSE